MLKTLTILIAALANLSCTTYSNNFYSGLNMSATHMSSIRNESAHDVNGSENLKTNKRVRGNGGHGGLFLGYLFRVENFGIGPELFYNCGKVEVSSSSKFINNLIPAQTTFKSKNKITSQYGVAARIGYFIESYFIYASLGTAKQKERFEVNAENFDGGAGTSHNYYYRKNSKKNRYTFGLGTQKSINEHMDLGLEYKTCKYPKKAYNFRLGDAQNTVFKSDFKYKLHTVSIRLIYKF